MQHECVWDMVEMTLPYVPTERELQITVTDQSND